MTRQTINTVPMAAEQVEPPEDFAEHLPAEHAPPAGVHAPAP
jgi:hypothetical protein